MTVVHSIWKGMRTIPGSNLLQFADLSLKQTVRQVVQHVADQGGRIQLRQGVEPTIIYSSRLALEQWKYALSDITEPTGKPILIVATRNARWIEWATFMACYALQLGYRPTLLYSSREVERVYGRYAGFWQGVSTIPFLKLVDLDNFAGADDDGALYYDFAAKKAHMVAAYNLRVEEYEGGDLEVAYEQAVHQATDMLRAQAATFERFLTAHPFPRIICPSGLIENTAAYLEVVNRLSIPTIFVEAWSMRPGHMVWNLNRPALHYDIDGWMKVLGEWDARKEAEARNYMAFREGTKVDDEGWLNNFHQVQRSTKDSQLPAALEQFLQRPGKFILMGTNVIGDSATLERATIFRSQRDWISRVVSFVKEQSELNLILRAHPDEVFQKAKLRLGDVAQEVAAQADNVYIIHGAQNVNTYSLVDRVDVGLAWVSNIGLDMAIRGKPVILAGAAQYAHLGVCHAPTSQEEYFRLLLTLADRPQGPDAAAIRRGQAYHHIVFKLMSLDADSPRYNAADYRLGPHYVKPEQDKFFRILVGELSDKGLPIEDEQVQ